MIHAIQVRAKRPGHKNPPVPGTGLPARGRGRQAGPKVRKKTYSLPLPGDPPPPFSQGNHENRRDVIQIMGSEYIIAEYSGGSRGVLSGGNNIGVTNSLLAVAAGYVTLTLDGPADYTTVPMPVMVTGTSVANPMSIVFTPAAPPGAAMMVARVAGAPPSKPKRARAQGNAKRKPTRNG
jgi:hypothetical protein